MRSVPTSDGTRGAGSVVEVEVEVLDVVVVLVDVVLVVLVVDVVVPVVEAGRVLVEVTTDVVVGAADELVGDVLGSAALSSPSLQAATIATSASTYEIGRARRRCRGATASMMPWHSREQGSYRALNLLRQCSQRHRSS